MVTTTSARQGTLFSGLKAYVGQTRSRELIATLAAAGVGECVTRGQLPPRRTSWFYDNGAFEDFVHKRPFNYLQYSRDLRAIRCWSEAEGGIPVHRPGGGSRLVAPDFVVLPDLVGAGERSLDFSLDHYYESTAAGVPLYLAVQDGMTAGQVGNVLGNYPKIAGLFIGGTLEWKLRTAAQWIVFARPIGRPVHIGRVGTVERVRWASEIGATSIDSSLPLWSASKMERFLEAVA